jgi:hypothetical protein
MGGDFAWLNLLNLALYRISATRKHSRAQMLNVCNFGLISGKVIADQVLII